MSNLRQAAQQALEALEGSRRAHHYCEDTWYSCPQHEGGCANEAEGYECNCGADKANEKIDQAITAIEQALAEPEQKPVAWYCNQGLKRGVSLKQESPEWIPLYTALRAALAEPDYWQEEARRYAGNADYWRKRYEALAEPERKPLTDAEILKICQSFRLGYTDQEFARAIERAHGIGSDV